jgi:hypothetical protein
MTTSTAAFTRRENPFTARLLADRRRYKRVHIDMQGRFMASNRQEFPCRLYDISIGGAALLTQAPTPVAEGERVVAYFEHIGRLEGSVARVFEGGFAMSIQASLHKREKLCATLTWLVNKAELPGIDERRHDRLVPANEMGDLKLDEGHVVPCRIIDVSISGASIVTDAKPALGHVVMLGKLRARVVRHHETGIALEFLDVQNPTALRRHFGA